MRRGRLVLFVAASALLAAGVAFRRFRSEPRHDGRSVTEWVLRRDAMRSQQRLSGGSWLSAGPPPSGSPEERRRLQDEARRGEAEAVAALRAIGTNAFPIFGEMLEAHESTFYARLADAWRRRSWPNWPFRRASEWHALGGQAFDAAGEEAIPFLLGLLEQGNAVGRRNAALALASNRWRGPTVVPRLARALRDPEARVREAAAEALDRWGMGPADALIVALSDGDSAVRLHAAAALGRLGPRGDVARPELQKRLRDPEPVVVAAVLASLTALGEDSEEFRSFLRSNLDGPLRRQCLLALTTARDPVLDVVPLLWNLAEGNAEGDEVRNAAILALGRASVAFPESVRAQFVERLVPILEANGVESAVVEALGGMGPAGIAGLRKALRVAGDRSYVIAGVLEALRDRGAEAPGLVPEVAGLLDHSDHDVRRGAAGFLERRKAEATPVLLEALRGPIGERWRSVVGLLATWDCRDPKFGEALIGALDSREGLAVASDTLGRMTWMSERVVPRLLELGSPTQASDVRRAAIDALGRYGAEAMSARGFLEDLMNQAPAAAFEEDWGETADFRERSSLALHAAAALARIAPGDGAVRAFFDRVLATGEPEACAFAARALRESGILGRWAVPGLMTSLGGESLATRLAALEALGSCGSEAEEAVEALVSGLDDPSWRGYSDSVAQALARIGRPAVPGLVRTLEVGPKRAAALWALYTMGPASAPAGAALVPLLEDREPATRHMACRCLIQMGTNGVVWSEALERIASGAVGEPGRLAALALSVTDPTRSRGREGALRGLEDESDGVRALAAEVLGKMRPRRAEGVPALVAALRHPYESADVRRSIVEALGQLAPVSGDATRALVETLRDKDEWVAMAAVRALGEAGEASRDALPALRGLLDRGSGWPHGPEDIERALARIGEAVAGGVPGSGEGGSGDLGE